MMSEVRSDPELVDAIPKPTGLGMVSLSLSLFSCLHWLSVSPTRLGYKTSDTVGVLDSSRQKSA
jgi:hypothetical protein